MPGNLGRNFSSTCLWVRDRSHLEIVNLSEPRCLSRISLCILNPPRVIASLKIKIFSQQENFNIIFKFFGIGVSIFAVIISSVGKILHNIHPGDQSENCKPDRPLHTASEPRILLETIMEINFFLSKQIQAKVVSLIRVNARYIA
jgi:hypothetical protein